GIARIGESYVITARLASAADGTDLATFREEAASENELLTALGRLTKAVRAKAGESLRSIRASGELARVTTPSLAALRKYVEGIRLADEAGESDRGIALLREAVAIDTSFAMAWRKLGVLLFNSGRDVDGALEATSTAYRHRDRLSEMERLLTEAMYFSYGPRPDEDRALAAYESAMQLDSLNSTALNNAATIYGRRHMYERQEEMLRRVVRLPSTFGGAFTNLLNVQIRNRRSVATLDSTLQHFRERFGESHDFWEGAWLVAWGTGNIADADSIARAAQASSTTSRQALYSASTLSLTAELEGRLAEAIEQNARISEATYRLDPKPGNRLTFAIDTAYYQALYGDRNAALAAIARGRSRVPLNEVAPNDRPWYMLAWIGAMLQDPALAREALQGWERDQAGLAFDSVGAQAGYATFAAFAERNWTEVIAQTRVAEQSFEMPSRFASLFRGFAFEGLGQADSAIVSLERYLETPDPSVSIDAAYKARALQRLGELYEGKGDNARAIEYYSKFADLWKDADAKLQPQVREARQRIEHLQGKVG
ncbi:MAG TPA: hypothetical protein VFG84_04525, partial [Gemmatimonadaceae bacterium]|nr:hypothetical protein [Gemmatimonadaceae bacterium]